MSKEIESTLNESRVFAPPANLADRVGPLAIASMDDYETRYARSIQDPEGFWGEVAQELHWFTPWERVLEWNAPDAEWFVGGTTNLCYNCVDRQVESGHGDDVAIIWEGEPVDGGAPEVRRLTYADLQRETSRFAHALRERGVTKGDVVTIYMPMVPELAIAMLACVRIGAAHSIIFGGFSARAIADRVTDAESNVIVTADGGWRRGKVVPLKANVDAARDLLAESDRDVESVIVLTRCGNDTGTRAGDLLWEDAVRGAPDHVACEPVESEDMAFLLYTSGSTGQPKGIVHTTGGYMVYTYLTAKTSFNLVPDRGQVYWCTADIGWITGHSYIIYGVLPTRVPTLMYEGAPNFPDESRFWGIVERHKVSQFYTAPTAIRAFMKWGDEHPKKHDLSSLALLGSVGEPINPEAWMWYRDVIGGGNCPIVDTYWQTETAGHVITPAPGATPTVPGSCTRPFFGIDAAVVDADGNELPPNQGGLLVIRKPWPGMLRGVYGDRDRYIETYWSRHEGYYTAGDGARRDAQGNFWIMGRIDDVINVSGHRLGTMEIESALVGHGSVVEAAVVGTPHEIKGEGIAVFCTLASGHEPGPDTAETLRAHIAEAIGAIAKPDQIRFTNALPKTRSGKIMRRLLRSIAAGETEITQDMTTLEDYSVVANLQESSEG